MNNNFNYAISLANMLYGIEGKPDDLEEIGLIAWNYIGNKPVRLYKTTAKIDSLDLSVELPCNAVELEAVTYGYEDWNSTTNKHVNGDYNSQFVEHYIEARKNNTSPYYMSGKYARYDRVGSKLYFDHDYKVVNILYYGIIMDDDDLPSITDKEAMAIATYIAYTKKFKEGLIMKDQNSVQLAQMLQQEWQKKCDAARVPTHIDQNMMNEILNAKTSWDRKVYNKSFKPIK